MTPRNKNQGINRGKPAAVFLLIGFMLLLCCYVPYSPAAETTKLTAIVTGSADLHVAPDHAIISFSVVTSAHELISAQNNNRLITTELITAVSSVIDGDHNIKSTACSILPEYDFSGEKQESPLFIGFKVKNDIIFKIDDLKKMSDILKLASDAGAANINYINYQSSAATYLEEQVLAKALEQAQNKAQAIANASKKQLGEVIAITDQKITTNTPEAPSPLIWFSSDSVYNTNAPFSPANLIITATVTVKYELLK